MKTYILSILVGFLMFGAWLYITDDPSTAHFIEIGQWRWQIDRKYLWPKRTPIDVAELDHLIGISGPNSVITVNEYGTVFLKGD